MNVLNLRTQSAEHYSDIDLDNFVANDFGSIDDDESWLQDFNNDDDVLHSNNNSTTEQIVDSNGPAKKRKSEIIGVIKGYANELQKKRKLNSKPNDDEIDQLEAENRKIRLEFFDPIMNAFNTGDFDVMAAIMRNSVRDDCLFRAQYIKSGLRGLIPLLVFFGLLHEAYPDAMVKILERRISSTKKPAVALSNTASMPTPSAESNNDESNIISSSSAESSLPLQITESLQRVDYVYKLVGTSISSRPLPAIYNKAIEKLKDRTSLTQEDISVAISGLLAGGDGAHEGECAYIVETGLSFDCNNKIVEWTYEVLAADTR